MAQTDFFGPVINALVQRQRIIESKQEQEARQKRLELEERRIDQFDKQNERLLKQMENAEKAKRLQLGVELKGLTDDFRSQLTGTPESPASRSIPGASQVQQQPLLENILQQRGLASSLPQQGIMVRGQENAPVSFDIPDPFTGETQLKLPLGTTSELTRERSALENTRRQEEQRKLRLTGQLESLKARAKAGGELPAKILLERVKNENAIALETDRQKNREALANIRGSFLLQAAKIRKAGAAAGGDFANIAQEIGLGLQPLSGSVKDRAAITNILHGAGWVTPPKDLSTSVDALNDVPILLGQVDSIIEKIGEPTNPRVSQLGRQAQQFFTGSNEIINAHKSLEAFATPIMRQMGEKGMFSNRDIERGMSLLVDPGISQKDNLRRRELLQSMFEIGINNKVRSLPESQKRAIFEQYDIPFIVLTQEQIKNRYKEIDNFISGEAEATPTAPSANAGNGKPTVSGNGKIVTYKGKKYAVGEPFTFGGKKIRWVVENGEAIPEEVQ